MTALIGIQLGLGRLPCRVPDLISLFDIKILAIAVVRNVVVTIAGQAKKLCILIEGISAVCVGNQTEEILVSQIINPGKRCLRSCDDIFHGIIIKVTEFHNTSFCISPK